MIYEILSSKRIIRTKSIFIKTCFFEKIFKNSDIYLIILIVLGLLYL